jgi:NADH:ubiquinone oxidoreductase subunit 5 (subunit L)/multisubunit Na+/H+ antiporter MnhA subunit
VTAGLYLMVRNFDYLSAYPLILDSLLTIGLFTSFYAGLSALLEVDLKKIVALSTLSHLGFISFALGLG